MKPPVRYALAAVAFVAVATLALWPFLDPAGRSGVMIAAAVALPIQFVAFSVLVRYRGRVNGFMAAWAGGMLLRALGLGFAALLVARSQVEGAVPMLLSLAGFLFGLLVLEPVFFRPDSTETA